MGVVFFVVLLSLSSCFFTCSGKKEDETLWRLSLECSDECATKCQYPTNCPEYISLMEELNNRIFIEYTQPLPCNADQSITINQTHDGIWEIRHQFYDKHYDDIQDCRNRSLHTNEDKFRDCMGTVRVAMKNEIQEEIVKKIDDLVKKLAEKECQKRDL